MPSAKRRGPHPQDARLFSEATLSVLRQAVSDLSWLRTQGYAEPSALKLVGDRYQLTTRQRSAVSRAACSDQGLRSRSERVIAWAEVSGRELCIDGFNLIITLEAALAGGVLFRGRDGCLRDLSSLHGNYHVLADTLHALRLIWELLGEALPSRVTWYLDKPVSNSGRLAALIRSSSQESGRFPCEVHLVADPDRFLLNRSSSTDVIVSSDSLVLAGNVPWLNLASYVVEQAIPEALVVDLA